MSSKTFATSSPNRKSVTGALLAKTQSSGCDSGLELWAIIVYQIYKRLPFSSNTKHLNPEHIDASRVPPPEPRHQFLLGANGRFVNHVPGNKPLHQVRSFPGDRRRPADAGSNHQP